LLIPKPLAFINLILFLNDRVVNFFQSPYERRFTFFAQNVISGQAPNEECFSGSLLL